MALCSLWTTIRLTLLRQQLAEGPRLVLLNDAFIHLRIEPLQYSGGGRGRGYCLPTGPRAGGAAPRSASSTAALYAATRLVWGIVVGGDREVDGVCALEAVVRVHTEPANITGGRLHAQLAAIAAGQLHTQLVALAAGCHAGEGGPVQLGH